MSAMPDPTDGLLVITRINRLTGESESEVYEVVAANSEDDALLVRDGSDWYEVVQRSVPKPVGIESGLLTPEQRARAVAEFAARAGQSSELEQHREVIRHAYELDRRYPGQMEKFDDYLDGAPVSAVELIRALDPYREDQP